MELIPDDELLWRLQDETGPGLLMQKEQRRIGVRVLLWKWFERWQAEQDRSGVKDEGYHAVSTVVQMLK